MLDTETVATARHIAELAAGARDARDRIMTQIAERDPGEPASERGEPRPIERLGLEALTAEEPAHRALREAIEQLPDGMRRKLWAVMRTGTAEYARGDWPQALADAEMMPDDAIIVELAEEADLHDRLAKGLYELGAAEQPARRT